MKKFKYECWLLEFSNKMLQGTHAIIRSIRHQTEEYISSSIRGTLNLCGLYLVVWIMKFSF